jgi:hypothetical protein
MGRDAGFWRLGEPLLRVKPGPRFSAGSPSKNSKEQEFAEFPQNQKRVVSLRRSLSRFCTGKFDALALMFPP